MDGLIGSWLLRSAAKWCDVCVVLLLLLFVSVHFWFMHATIEKLLRKWTLCEGIRSAYRFDATADSEVLLVRAVSRSRNCLRGIPTRSRY